MSDLTPIQAFRRDRLCSREYFESLDEAIRALEAELAGQRNTIEKFKTDALNECEARQLVLSERDALKAELEQLKELVRIKQLLDDIEIGLMRKGGGRESGE